MYGWDIFKDTDHPITIGRPEFDTSNNMKTVGLILWINRSIWTIGRL